MLPVINRETVFALKGGTAINFFVRDLPRLSVDIDLVYLPVKERAESLTDISERMIKIAETAQRIIPGIRFQRKYISGTKTICGLVAKGADAIIKIEPNTTIRGSVYSPVSLDLCPKAKEMFELSLKTQSLTPEELYAGKLCAALDRQHPRDLFDVKLLFEHEGLSDKLRKAFIVYLISHNRPIEEVLNPGLQDIEAVYLKEFQGMTEEKVELKTLIETRIKLIEGIKSSLTLNEKKFLISFKMRQPEWQLLELENIDTLPAVKWKLNNLEKMHSAKHKKALEKLAKYLDISL